MLRVPAEARKKKFTEPTHASAPVAPRKRATFRVDPDGHGWFGCICCEAYEHLHHRRVMLRAVRRPGGWLPKGTAFAPCSGHRPPGGPRALLVAAGDQEENGPQAVHSAAPPKRRSQVRTLSHKVIFLGQGTPARRGAVRRRTGKDPPARLLLPGGLTQERWAESSRARCDG